MYLKKILSLIICMILLCPVLLSGCKSKEAVTKPALSEEKPVITWGIVRYNPFIGEINPYSEVIKYLETQFNCKITFKYYDAFSIKILKNLMTKGECPDIITMQSLSSEGLYLAANNYVVPAAALISSDEGLIPEKAWDILAEDGNALYGIPGRFATDEQIHQGFQKSFEGVYIAQPYYNLLGKPAITNMQSILDVSSDFFKQAKDLQVKTGISSEDEVVPVVLGNSGMGIETLKHLFGIFPVYASDDVAHLSIDSPNWTPLFSWLDDLNRISGKSMSLSGKSLTNILNGRNLVFIGSSNCIESFNSSLSPIHYEKVTVGYSGTASVSNPYGCCQTYVMKSSSAFNETKNLVRYLLSDDGNLLVKYGIKGKHWVRSQDSVIQLDWVIKEMDSKENNFANNVGMGQLMFLSNFEFDNPNLPDVFASSDDAFSAAVLNFKADSAESIKFHKIKTYENDLCQRIASIEHDQRNTEPDSQIPDSQTLKLYAEQYTIPSLKERYHHWKEQIQDSYVPK